MYPMRTVQPDIILNKGDSVQIGHIGPDDLGIISHDGAVVMVVPQPLVKVVGHAGIKDGLHPFVEQGLHVSMQQLGRVADRVGGNGALALDVELTAGLRGEHHVEVQLGEEISVTDKIKFPME